uniref:Uncharacterized protein n=1 Tax=Arundo donax TaxID=35708 RepID=A0A0A9BAC8_ARUDO
MVCSSTCYAVLFRLDPSYYNYITTDFLLTCSDFVLAKLPRNLLETSRKVLQQKQKLIDSLLKLPNSFKLFLA